MLSRRLLLTLSCALLAISPARAADLLYVGIVNRDGALARSGPNDEYYPTDALRQGDRVEVYHIDEGGWCAIRPPAGSFSMVLDDQLHMTDTPRLAEVASDGVLAFVGSRIRQDRHAVQVELNRGEFVEIVGTDEFPDESTGQLQTWYRIAPPAGEFRWVHLEYVDREDRVVPPPDDVAVAPPTTVPEVNSDAPSRTQAADNGEAAAPAGSPADSVGSEAGTPLRSVLAAQWKPLPKGTLDERAAQLARQRARLEGRVAVQDHRGANPEANRVVGHGAAGETPPGLLGHVDTKPLSAAEAGGLTQGPQGTSGVTLAAAIGKAGVDDVSLDELDVAFSLMVAKPVTQWQLDSLMLQADRIAQQAPTPATRDRARALLEKMRQFHQHQHPRAPFGGFAPVPAASGLVPAATVASPPAASAPVRTAARGPAYSPTTTRLPRFLTALESLMPSQPSSSTGRTTGARGTLPPTAASRSPVTTVSVQTPETAPPDPASQTDLPLTPGVVADAASWRAAGAGSTLAGVPPAPAAGSQADMLDRIRDTILYPLGAGPTPAIAAAATNPSYDGTGWLVPIVSRHGRRASQENYMPPFALTDQDGNVLQFVTPAPGVNLHRYMRKEIGVFGQQHPLDHLNEPHITASRIVMLDRHRR